MRTLSNRYLIALVLSATLILGVCQAIANERGNVIFKHIIESQIKAFQSGEYDQAFDFAAPEIQHRFKTAEKFVGMISQHYMPVFNPAWYQFEAFEISSGFPMQSVLLQGPKGKIWKAIYRFELVKGDWKIFGVRLVQMKAAGA